MRWLKCHPGIGQSGSKGFSFGLRWWRIRDGLTVRSPIRSEIQLLCNITGMDSSKVLPCVSQKKTQISQAESGLGVKQKHVFGDTCFISQKSNKEPTIHVMRRAMMVVVVPGWGLGQLWRGSGQRGGQTILCKPTPICSPALYARPALFSRCQIFFLKTGNHELPSKTSKAQPRVICIVKRQPKK